jgi:hypothetical protein
MEEARPMRANLEEYVWKGGDLSGEKTHGEMPDLVPKELDETRNRAILFPHERISWPLREIMVLMLQRRFAGRVNTGTMARVFLFLSLSWIHFHLHPPWTASKGRKIGTRWHPTGARIIPCHLG